MRSASVLPIPLFRSANQAALLSSLFLSEKKFSAQDLSSKLDIPYPTVHREITRLLNSGLINEERIGNYRFFEPNRLSPFYSPVRELILVISGPVPLLQQELAQIPGIEWVALFGSWAHRLLGKEGKAPHDVDLLVVGNPEVRLVNKACSAIGKKLGWEVNPIILTRQEWRQDTPFLRQVRSGGLVPVIGTVEGSIKHESDSPNSH